MYREEPKQVTITIHSLEQASEVDAMDKIEDRKVYAGTRYEKGDKTYIKYEEQQEGVTITSIVVVTPEEVIIRRTGGMESRLQFRESLNYSFLYHTMYGDVPLTIETKRFLTAVEEDSVRIQLIYDILSQGSVVSYHELQFEAKTK